MHASVLLLGALCCVAAQPSAPTITTSCGSVTGSTDAVRHSDGVFVHRWAHIPYAAPPVGDLRWRAPTPVACPWAGTINGSMFPPMCPQTSGIGSEDCLYLNVIRPTNATAASRLPVLVYFHGGNLIGGSAPSFIPSAAVIAAQLNAVVISVGYRLNTLGWLALDELAAESGFAGNYGLLDAIQALQWVRDNAATFGGDPSHVTIFGQSSGGTLIFGLYSAPGARGLFTGALSLSGSPNITQDATSKRAQDAPIAAALGCGPPLPPAAMLACLRALPAHNVSRATPPPWDTPGIFGWPTSGIPPPSAGGNAYAGIIHVDGVVVTQSFEDALVNDLVPAALIISNMAAEGDGGPGAVVRNFTSTQWEAFLNQSFARFLGGGAAEAARARGAYADAAAVDPQLAYDSIAADYGLTCAGRSLALRVGGRRSRPLYLLYNAFPPSQWGSNGAGRWPDHGMDLREMTWAWSYDPTPDDSRYAAVMQSMLSDFATGGGLMPAAWNWPPVAAASPPYTLVLAANGAPPAAPWPGGGVRAVADWRAGPCDALEANGLGRQYWWCD